MFELGWNHQADIWLIQWPKIAPTKVGQDGKIRLEEGRADLRNQSRSTSKVSRHCFPWAPWSNLTYSRFFWTIGIFLKWRKQLHSSNFPHPIYSSSIFIFFQLNFEIAQPKWIAPFHQLFGFPIFFRSRKWSSMGSGRCRRWTAAAGRRAIGSQRWKPPSWKERP